MSPLADHWHFALANAISQFENFAYRFDADLAARGHAYCGAVPENLVAIIQGFLSEREHLWPSEIRRLEELKRELEEGSAPSYEAGKLAASKIWQEANDQEIQRFAAEYTPFEFFRARAWREAPKDNPHIDSHWFVEGFCQQWQNEWMEYWQVKFGKENDNAD